MALRLLNENIPISMIGFTGKVNPKYHDGAEEMRFWERHPLVTLYPLQEHRPQGLSYAYEKFGNAVDLLATGKSDIRHRLRPAALEIIPVAREYIPEPLRADFDWIRQQLSRFEPTLGEGRLDATLFRIRSNTAQKIAERIVSLAAELQSYFT